MWSSNNLEGVQAAKDIMSRDDALTYLRFLHLPEAVEGVNPKLSPIVNVLRDNCLKNFRAGPVPPISFPSPSPSTSHSLLCLSLLQNVGADEASIRTSTRSHLVRNTKGKKCSSSINVKCINDSRNGYLLYFFVWNEELEEAHDLRTPPCSRCAFFTHLQPKISSSSIA